MSNLERFSEEEIEEIIGTVGLYERDPEAAERFPWTPDQVDAVDKLTNDQAAEFTKIVIAKSRAAYLAKDSQGTIIHRYPTNEESLPFYPSRAAAIHDLSANYCHVLARRVELDELFSRYLRQLPEDGILVELFPRPGVPALLIDAGAVQRDVSAIIEHMQES